MLPVIAHLQAKPSHAGWAFWRDARVEDLERWRYVRSGLRRRASPGTAPATYGHIVGKKLPSSVASGVPPLRRGFGLRSGGRSGLRRQASPGTAPATYGTLPLRYREPPGFRLCAEAPGGKSPALRHSAPSPPMHALPSLPSSLRPPPHRHPAPAPLALPSLPRSRGRALAGRGSPDLGTARPCRAVRAPQAPARPPVGVRFAAAMPH